MGIKRVVDTSFWTDGKVEDFTPEDRYFMLYLLTNPYTTQLGIYEISIKRAAFEMGYSMDAVRALIERFEFVHGVVIYSKETNEIAIKNFLRHSIIKGGAPVRDLLIKEMKAVKNKALISKVFKHIKSYNELNTTVKNIIADYDTGDDTGDESPYESYHDLYNNENDNDNENDNENENENEKGCAAAERPAPPPSVPYESIKNLYNEICKSFSRCTALSDARKKAIKARFNSGYTLEDFRTLFIKAEASSFLKGQNSRNWTANFDWLIKDANMAKVLDGNYDEKSAPYKSGTQDYGNPEDFYK